jgi:hypothetical protein
MALEPLRSTLASKKGGKLIKAVLAYDLSMNYAYDDALGRDRSMVLKKAAGSSVTVSSIDIAIPSCYSAVITFDDGKQIRISLNKLTSAVYFKGHQEKNQTNYKKINNARALELKMLDEINRYKSTSI